MSEEQPEGYEEIRQVLQEHWPSPSPSPSTRAEILQRIETKHSRKGWIVAATMATLAVGAFLFVFYSSSQSSGTASDPLAQIANADFSPSGGSSIAVLQNNAEGVHIHLERGSLRSRVSKRKSEQFFVVSAAEVEVHVVGTDFSVSVDENRLVQVEAYEGRVEVHSEVGVLFLDSPGHWDSAEAHLAVERKPVIRSLVDAGTVKLDSNPALPLTDAGVRADRDTTARWAQHDASPPRKPAVSTPTDLFVQAQKLENSGKSKEAIRMYRRAARGKGELAEDALYAVGRLSLKIGDLGAARSVFFQYKTRYKRGRYTPAAYVHLLTLWRGNAAKRRSLAHEFLARFPDDPRASRFQTVLDRE